MNQIKYIIQKEFRTFFNSAIGYVFLVVFLTFSGWMFFRTFFLFGQVNMRDFFNLLPWTFLFLIPAFTMRSWAEEFRSGTIETLLTNGTSLGKIVIAKFLSVMLFLALALALTFPFAISVSFLGNLDWGVVFISYLGALFLGAAYASIGLFISAITKNQIVAFILSLIVCFAFFILGESLVTVFLPEFLGKIFHFLGLGVHFNSMTRGVIDSRDLVFYISFITLFLSLNIFILSQKFWPKQKFWKGVLASVILTSFLVNIGGTYVFARFDGTENKNYTLSSASQKILKNIQHPVAVKAFISANIPAQMQSISQDVKDILSEYKSRSGGNISLEILDPLKNDTAKNWSNNFGIVPLQVQVIEKDQQKVVKAYLGIAVAQEDSSKEGFAERFSKYETIPVVTKMSDFEYQLTAAIKKVSLEKLPTLGVLTDHNTKKLGNFELSPYADEKSAKEEVPMLDLLEKNYEIKNLALADENFNEEIKDIKTILIVGPTENFSDEEADKIKKLIDEGKNIIFLADKMNVIGNNFAQNAGTDFSNILDDFGITQEKNLVADLKSESVAVRSGIFQMMRRYPFWIKSTDLAKNSSITKDLPSLSFPWTGSLKLTDKKDLDTTILAKTSPYFIVKEGQTMTEVPVETEKKEETKPEDNSKDTEKTEEESKKESAKSTTEEAKENTEKTDQKTPEPPKTKSVLADTPIMLSPDQDFGFTKTKKDPLPLAVLVKKNKKGSLLFIGNSRFVTREFAQSIPTNLIFLNNAIDAFTIGDDLISIRSKQVIDRPITLIPENQKMFIRWVNTLAIAFFVIMYGLLRKYWRGKQKQLLLNI